MCSWGEGYETPSAIVTCVCPCHADKPLDAGRPLEPKGPRAVNGARVLVPKK